jgi:hypothetical protein
VQPSFGFRSNFYAEWRERNGRVALLRENTARPPERLLQLVWFHQRLLRDKLFTLDGRQVQVLHPGFWSYEGGPDFRGAVVQLGGAAPQSGDVEVDVDSSGWRGHGHDRNPAFKNVILHLVWEAGAKTDLPTIEMQHSLDSPVNDLALWIGSEAARQFPESLRGQCAAPLRNLSAEKLAELLCQAALVRLQGKAVQLQARAREAGWEQALWEGWLRALGYKHNVWPMQRLAELSPRLSPADSDLTPLALQARLLGVSGLLPTELTRQELGTDRYVRRLWDFWWRERETFHDCTMPRTVWRFHGLRPANHPQRRIALAAHWLARGNLALQVEKWGAATAEDAALTESLTSSLQVAKDDFWSRHWTLRSKAQAKAQPLLGSARVSDLAVNVILPWLWARAFERQDERARVEIERRYFSWPRAEDNSLLRLARQRLLGSASPRSLFGAAAQQGLLQIVRDFCEHSSALCSNCQFPELVRHWAS